MSFFDWNQFLSGWGGFLTGTLVSSIQKYLWVVGQAYRQKMYEWLSRDKAVTTRDPNYQIIQQDTQNVNWSILSSRAPSLFNHHGKVVGKYLL